MALSRKTKRPPGGEPAGPLTSDLAARIKRAQAAEAAPGDAEISAANRNLSGWNRGMRLGTEFIAAILVGAGIGYLLDLWLKTGPWLMLVMLLVGFAAGVLNVVRSAAEMNRAAPPPTAAMRVPDDEEDE
ncbi:MAG TPA: AtpZ/AtpI family protein [Devosia sp.]|jgi:ATP synthase protein I|uniref:AtpZ/AtpI family protein n=1 Tax=Devosia sp. TaxID=1871048 RepID=UPI002DDD0642|nr:AtpZ/AtpI family protein [Devosia sp.]HEV2516888.1 AtpZ/AtpI family protein [Devosia sp.]